MPAVNQINPATITQEEMVSFLLDPRVYPHIPGEVRLVQTHASLVFLAPPLVYKVKKAVNFGFLDFSTLEKRRFFCEREVALNRRLSPAVYLGVVPISLKDGRLVLGAGDEVVEYAVKMRQLSERDFLHRRLERGEVELGDLDRIVAVLKGFYEQQTPTAEVEAWGRIDRLRISTDENFRQTEPFVGQTLSRPAFEAIRCFTNRFYERHADLFAARIRQRWIRDCHGDLHLAHIHLTPRALQIVDCIEFNDRLRYLDVANDIAFLAMDLDYHGRPDLARYFVRQMAGALGDAGMERLIDFYKCYRAYVRGKVESLNSLAAGEPEADRLASRERARRYFRLALQYAVAGPEPRVWLVMGRVGSGKTALAGALAQELGCAVLSSDQVRKELAGLPLEERSPAAVRAGLYSKAMTRQTYDALLRRAREEAAAGRSVIVDATFARREYRDQWRRELERAGLAYGFIEARAPAALVEQRVREREGRPGVISDARLEDLAGLHRAYEPPVELSPPLLVAASTAEPLETTLANVLRELVEGNSDRNSMVAGQRRAKKSEIRNPKSETNPKDQRRE